MTITYPVKSGLYVNLTNRCPCACAFCIRNNGKGAYGSGSLWLEREPTADEVFAAIAAALSGQTVKKLGEGEQRNGNPSVVHLSSSPSPASYAELVFCGYGEPTERLDVLLDVAKREACQAICEKIGVPLRVRQLV